MPFGVTFCVTKYKYGCNIFSFLEKKTQYYYYSSNTIQIAKGEKNIFYSNLFLFAKIYYYIFCLATVFGCLYNILEVNLAL